METEIKIVFLDIDGTIYIDGKLVPSAIHAIQALQKNNIPVALCTGRSVLHTHQLQFQLSIPYGVYFNGGLTQAHEHTLHATPIDATVVNQAMNYFQKIGQHIILHTADEAISFEDTPERIQPLLDAFQFPPLRRLSQREFQSEPYAVYQLNVFMRRDMDTLVQNMFPECLIYRWDAFAVDLQRRKSDKSVGASALLSHLGISAENAVHIGDGGNDIGMFETMGMSFAMGNAEHNVKQFAKHVTSAAQDDGVFHALSKLGLI